jgi:outer membrane usher protein
MTRVEARGALVATGGLLMATPSVDDGLAIVEVPGGERIPVFLENQPVAARAGGGRPAIVTGLQPYVANRISVDPEALPITGELGGVEQVVAPGWRQAARVVFGAREVHPARLRLVDENGSTLPLGLVVSLGSGEEPTVTGYDGEVFLNDFEPGAPLVVQRSGVPACRAVLPAAMVQDPLARATQVICRSYSTESHK